MAKKARSGWNSRVSVSGTPLNMGKFDTTSRGDDQDTTTFEDGGLETGTIGVEVVEWTCGGNWDAGKNAYDDPPGLFPRDDLPNLRFYESVDDNIFWLFPVARVLSARNGAAVKDLVSFEASGKSNGAFSPPTGSV